MTEWIHVESGTFRLEDLRSIKAYNKLGDIPKRWHAEVAGSGTFQLTEPEYENLRVRLAKSEGDGA